MMAPIRASPTTGPTTAPAIQAFDPLLGAAVGVAVPVDDVVEADALDDVEEVVSVREAAILR